MLIRLQETFIEEHKKLKEKYDTGIALSGDEESLLVIHTAFRRLFNTPTSISDNPEAIKKAIETLELFPYSTAHSNRLGEYFNYLSCPTLIPIQKPFVKGQTISKPVSDEVFTTLLRWHTKLMTFLAWSYSYPLENGEVNHPAIQAWKADMQALKEGDSYLDFKRTIKIGDSKLKDPAEEDIEQALKELLAKTSLSEQDKSTVLTWLQHNGGQGVMGFLYEMLPGKPGGAVNLEMRWFVEKGNLYFSFANSFNSFIDPQKQTGLYRDDSDILREVAIHNVVEIIQQKKAANINLPALLHTRGKIALEVVEGVVIPKVVSLSMISTTDKLLHPAQALQKDNKPLTITNQNTLFAQSESKKTDAAPKAEPQNKLKNSL